MSKVNKVVGPSMLDLSPGTIVDSRYEILHLIAEGGMGSVFKAREIGLERIIALKILKGDQSCPDGRMRFEREGKLLSNLHHPNILQCYRLGIWMNKMPYIAMEYLEGDTLRQRLDSAGTITTADALAIAAQVCNALVSAHGANIVHRDLKPSNIMLLSGSKNVKVVDFGLARVLPGVGDVSQHLTQTGALVGTVFYMSPEQCMGKESSPQSDIYSFGCMFYEMVSGTVPFTAENPLGLIHKHVHEKEKALSKLMPSAEFPAGLEAVIARCMEKDPSRRYATAGDLLKDIELVVAGSGFQITDKKESRRKTLSITVLFSIIAVISLTTFLMFTRKEIAPTARETKAARRRTELDHTIASLQESTKRKKQRLLEPATTPEEKQALASRLYADLRELAGKHFEYIGSKESDSHLAAGEAALMDALEIKPAPDRLITIRANSRIGMAEARRRAAKHADSEAARLTHIATARRYINKGIEEVTIHRGEITAATNLAVRLESSLIFAEVGDLLKAKEELNRALFETEPCGKIGPKLMRLGGNIEGWRVGRLERYLNELKLLARPKDKSNRSILSNMFSIAGQYLETAGSKQAGAALSQSRIVNNGD